MENHRLFILQEFKAGQHNIVVDAHSNEAPTQLQRHTSCNFYTTIEFIHVSNSNLSWALKQKQWQTN